MRAMRDESRTRSALSAIVVVVAMLGAYPLAYAALRASKVLVHTASFVSEEGENAHTFHDIDSSHAFLVTAFRPLVDVELAVHRRLRP